MGRSAEGCRNSVKTVSLKIIRLRSEFIHPTWDTISYQMTTGTTSVSDLDIGTLARDAVSRGYLSPSCYPISVEAGFGRWNGAAGDGAAGDVRRTGPG
jgi:hypothetical protein